MAGDWNKAARNWSADAGGDSGLAVSSGVSEAEAEVVAVACVDDATTTPS
jgi:hypothetical protein